jgi:hypothetical protein
MQKKTVVSKKLLGVALLGAFCAAPAFGLAPAAQAALPYHHVVRGVTLTGVVTDILSSQKIDIRVSGKLYNVYPAARLPRLIKKGDTVIVTGRREGNNDIRNATVNIVHNDAHHH